MANRNNHLRNVATARLGLRNDDDRRYKPQTANGTLEEIRLRSLYRILEQDRCPDRALEDGLLIFCSKRFDELLFSVCTSNGRVSLLVV